MEKKQNLILCGLFLSLLLVSEVIAQSDRSQIIALMKQQEPDACNNASVTVEAESVKIGPGKFGFIGSCSYGGGPRILFLKVGAGFKKLLSIDIGMNGGFGLEKAATKGFFNVRHYERSGNEFEETIYRWNGTRYVAGRPRTSQVP